MAEKMGASTFDIFIVAAPGLEAVLADEVKALGHGEPRIETGGVTIHGGWRDVWRANLELRGASRVLARIATFKAKELVDLERLARQVPWGRVLKRGASIGVEATCRKSKIYHTGAVEERIAAAISAALGVEISDAPDVWIMARIDNDIVTLSVDTSGELLHRRGFKAEVNKAPLRETMAALFLRASGYAGQEPVLDPMCGSGTFLIEAAEMAAGLKPGRARRFAFEHLVGFDKAAWDALRAQPVAPVSSTRFYGSDRDAGAIAMSRANAERAGVAERITFEQRAVAELVPPAGPPGLVICNPPYGTRIGERAKLLALYRQLGTAL
ncbi:MAG: hypothetical protein RL291_621, partial [Pseudomonadota bacterium]